MISGRRSGRNEKGDECRCLRAMYLPGWIMNITAYQGAEKKVADYVVGHEKQAQYMSISELAEECGVAEATISRFCRRMGYKGYSAFLSWRWPIRFWLPSGGRSPQTNWRRGRSVPVRACTTRTWPPSPRPGKLPAELIRKAVDYMLEAGKVLCMGQGGSMIMAQEATHLFFHHQADFYPVCDSHMQAIWAAQLTQGDVVLHFSYSGATRDLVEVMAQARERGARNILITRFPKSPGALYADVVLQCGAKEGPLRAGNSGSPNGSALSAGCAFYEMCQRDRAGTEAIQERIADALSDKHL